MCVGVCARVYMLLWKLTVTQKSNISQEHEYIHQQLIGIHHTCNECIQDKRADKLNLQDSNAQITLKRADNFPVEIALSRQGISGILFAE